MAADDPLRFSLPGVDGAKRSLGPPSTAPTYLSESASSSPKARRLLGSGRFNAEELKCFQRIPSPSSTYQQKAEVYWQNMGPMRKVHGDLGLHTLPAMRGEFYRYRAASSPQEAKEETTRQEPVAEKPTLLPREEMTASLLDEIYPRRPPSREKEEDARGKSQNQKLRKQTASNLPEQTGHISGERATLANGLAANKNLSQASRRLIHFRQRILEKFSTMKSAFETFAQEHGPHGTTKELTKKEFSRFLFRHFNGLPKEEHIKIFEFLDHDKNGVVSLDEFHTAVEAAAPVKSLEDLRRKWIALGYTSMRQALLGMDLHKEPGRSFTLAEFGAHLARVGIEEEIEHQNIFGAIRDPHSSHQTVTLEMLAAAMSAISPSLLLEDLRDKILKKFGTLSNCFAALDMDQGESLDIGEFIRYAVPAWKLTAHEAGKAFRLIDVDGSLQISKDEFVTALTLSEPNLYLDEIRRKVRQRFRSMRGLLNEGNEDDIEVDEVDLKPPPPPAVEIAPSRKGSLYQRHSIVVQDSPRSDGNGNGGMTAEETGPKNATGASWIAKHSGLGAEKAQDLLKDLVGPASETEDDGRTPEEYQEMLGQVVGFEMFPAHDCRLVVKTLAVDTTCVANGAILLELVFVDLGSTEREPPRGESQFQADPQLVQDLEDSIPASLRAVPYEKNGIKRVQLSEQDTKALFNLMDVNRDGKLTTTEFEHGVRLFAPSTALEDLRLACISKYGGIPEAFASLRPEQREASLEYHQLKKILEDIRIWDEGTGDLRLIMDIVECTRDGGTSIGELMAALQAGQSGTQVRLPAEQRDAKVRQQVKWQMAPFRRCASDLRAHVREKLNAHELEQMWNPRSQESHVADKSKSAALRAETQTAIHKWKRDKSLPALRRIDHEGQDPSWAGLSVAAEEELSSNTIPWGPMRTSFSKVFLKTLDTKELRPIINSMHHYYATAGETVTSREAFLNKQQSRFEQFKSCTHHYKLLTRQPGGT
ncbi:AP1M1 [Symbiodinium sp. CCMP2592]|nr:AP1M1 [Symbiodinium sp. CCMP2592]